MQNQKLCVLTGNHLKLLAALTMLLDHVGVLLFPQVLLLRVIGRISYPVFAFMIAEGCHYTRNKLRYFLMIFGLGVSCQLVYYFVSGDTYLNILLTFSFSVLLIFLLQRVQAATNWKQQFWCSVAFALGVFAAIGADQLLTIDYGFWGIMTPVFASLPQGKTKTGSKLPVLMMALGLLLLAADMKDIQYYALLAVPLLLLYSGQRGKTNLKYFFYIFYPVHLVVLQGIAWILR